MKKGYLLAPLLIVVFGFAKLPLEQRHSDSLIERGLRQPVDMSLGEELGQGALIAMLGGYRSILASLLYVESQVFFENREWAKVETIFRLVTSLQPQFERYWELGGWHLAYNAASNYRFDESRRLAVREVLFREWLDRGIAMLEDGLRHLPDSWRLHADLAEIYRSRVEDPRMAAHHFRMALANGARPLYERMLAYELVLLSDRESWQEAYDILMDHYRQGHRMPSAIRDIKILEERLDIPHEQRIPDEAPPPRQPEPQPATGATSDRSPPAPAAAPARVQA